MQYTWGSRCWCYFRNQQPKFSVLSFPRLLHLQSAQNQSWWWSFAWSRACVGRNMGLILRSMLALCYLLVHVDKYKQCDRYHWLPHTSQQHILFSLYTVWNEQTLTQSCLLEEAIIVHCCHGSAFAAYSVSKCDINLFRILLYRDIVIQSFGIPNFTNIGVTD